MNRNRVLAAIVIRVSLLAIGNVAFAVAAKKQNHHDGKAWSLQSSKLTGTHDIDRKERDHYSRVSRKQGRKDFPPSTSCMTPRDRFPSRNTSPTRKWRRPQVPTSPTPPSLYLKAPTWAPWEIGYSYVDDDGNEEIYWFPAEEISGTATRVQSPTFH